MGIWTGHHLGGFAWQKNPGLEFNWHPLLMTIGMIYLYGNGMLNHMVLLVAFLTFVSWFFSGILMYRMFRNERKRKLKLLHAGIMIAVFFLTVIALKAVFDSHNLKPCAKPSEEGDFCPIPNLYSLHSWMGLITVILFLFQVNMSFKNLISELQFHFWLFQWLAGLVTFLFPGLASHLRSSYMPVHVFFGLMIFVSACATALLGITEKAIFKLG